MSQISDSPTGPMSQGAYARRRGVSQPAVSKAIKSGRLKASVNAEGKITDPDLADREWAGNSDYTDAPQRAPAPAVKPAQQGLSFSQPAAPAPKGPDEDDIGTAAAREKHWKAALAELEYRKEAGELVPARDVEREVEGRYTRVRTKLLGIPSRARQVLPELTLGGVAKLEQLVREALEELSA